VHTAMPGLPEFDYVKPATLQEASNFLLEHQGQARPFMGGTDVFVRMRDGFWKEKYLVDVKGLDGMGEIAYDPAQGLTIGAAVNMNRVAGSAVIREHYPLLAESAQTVASYQLRNRATLAGNLCNGSPAADTAPACLVYNGSLRAYGPTGERLIPLSEFFIGPGQTALQPGEIVTATTFPPPPARHAGHYIKLGRNALSDLAVVGVAVLGYPDERAGSGYTFRIALAAVAPVPLLAADAMAVLAGKPIDEETIAAAAEAAMSQCRPIDDVRSSGRYRKLMVRNLTKRALRHVVSRLVR
jgi:CO/xanthine dehydrogenase FAD-binding subunit